MKLRNYFAIAGCMLLATVNAQSYQDLYRPQIHFSPKKSWMNDPNGMVYYKDIYHLFFQYYPESTVWGPMHWGHATSKDMVHWQEQPIALYPDSLGYIFSGSAVADVNNTSGFGKNGKAPLVAIYTNHDPVGEKAQRNNFQTQSIAYSIDEGKSWTKYEHNPVLANPGITDFRDPKVRWYEAGKKWIMTLATKDRITFFSSPNLKEWTKESSFGQDRGAHGGVWECPDLFPLSYEGRTIWVLLVSINPGAPNGGSGTQYFTGTFDGHSFMPDDNQLKWIDYGRDDYAGVTWSNTGNRIVFLGWMSNWMYGQAVPTQAWRSANTIPRQLSLKKVNGSYYLASDPVKELNTLVANSKTVNAVDGKNYNYPGKLNGPFRLSFNVDNLVDHNIILSNSNGEKLIIGYEKSSNQFFIDRSKSGETNFEQSFGNKQIAPRIATSAKSSITLYIDVSSVELFADNGLTVMTSIMFPSKPYDSFLIESGAKMTIQNLSVDELKSIWK
ncbi:glycoside hydrolase family 32 protein [Danxiaibacter flavus]|uniref:Glycoside hydrolase family 32 protein n=1 Tax=Danxiaibacter flavus TaxID=3049108 RepID=A0ABV3ZBU6_9BACT|nr:glycoside hydrolase family 32 protein [Chitinophagaceae bacterium DXS]